MKKLRFLPIFIVLLFVIVSCKNESETSKISVDFEDVKLPVSGYWDGSDKSGILINSTYKGSFVSKNIATFENKYTVSSWGGSWSGFACSSKADTVNGTYVNQYSVYAGSGTNKSKQFAVAFDSAVFKIEKDYPPTELKSMYVTNSTYTYKVIRDGNAYSKKFGNGDWFKMIITGYLGSIQTGVVEVYLADFRSGKSIILKDWIIVDLTPLYDAQEIRISFDSSDKSEWGVNTPKYVCIDNIELERTDLPD